ncbi:hypothetical protein NQ314_015637 [Rhamnusium bicolor]|uniref:CCHC-type domain-containing protein n=1 Tax=Rhamnusium bicolor TaxID=1586634 RepID=A0AAV8X0N8_9CUCU|nr:hypothetical protein NQ314_015637 [Rhamnusium bicolor]
MVINCVAFGCNNLADKRSVVQFHGFPFKRPLILKEWIKAIRRDNWQPMKFSKLYSDHFLTSDYEDIGEKIYRRLKDSAIPSVFKFPQHLQKKIAPRRVLKRCLPNHTVGGDNNLNEDLNEIRLLSVGVNNVIDVAEESVDAMTNEQKEAFKKNDTKAKCIIVQCISDKHLEYIKDAKSAGGMLRSLKNVFERKSTFSKLYIMKKLLKLKCTSEHLQDHFMQVETLLRELGAAGATLDESDKVCYLLLTMPEKYDIVITAIETVTTDITLEFVKSRLLDAELKFKDSQPEDDLSKNCAFNTGKYLASRKCFECGEYGHFYRNCPKNSKEMETSDSDTSRGYTRRDRARSYGRGWRRQANMTLNENSESREEDISFITEVITAGYCDYGGIAPTNTEDIASEALLFQIVSYENHFKCPVGYFITNKLSAELQSQLLLSCIKMLFDVGIRVRSITCDGTGSNLSTLSKLGATIIGVTSASFKHPSLGNDATSLNIYGIDTCHMLKLARNAMAEKNYHQKMGLLNGIIW